MRNTQDASLSEKFGHLKKEELLLIVSLPENSERGCIGKYRDRIASAQSKMTFGTPDWPYSDRILKLGPYKPKTKRGVYHLIRDSVALFGSEGVRAAELVRFLYHNVSLVDGNSFYTTGRPCVPWIEDYIASSLTKAKQFLIIVDESGAPVTRKNKRIK